MKFLGLEKRASGNYWRVELNEKEVKLLQTMPLPTYILSYARRDKLQREFLDLPAPESKEV